VTDREGKNNDFDSMMASIFKSAGSGKKSDLLKINNSRYKLQNI
jgi:hypothetical protein